MRNDRGYLRVGVTGGIGAGKSAVCALFATRGRVVLSADDIARHMMESDPEIMNGVRRLFGAEAYHADGTLNRELVAHAIFGDPRQRKQLDTLVHPPVISALLHTLDTLPAGTRAPYTIVEAALMYESGMHRSLDSVIVVHASEAVRIERLLNREGSSRAEILKRFRAQLPAGEKRERGDFVIMNEGSLASLREKVVFLDMLLTRMVG